MSDETKPTRFDDSLLRFVEVLVETLGNTPLEKGWVLRDASGRLAFILGEPIPGQEREVAADRLLAELPAYCREGRIILDREQPGVPAILRRGRGYTDRVPLPGGDLQIQLIEQRIVGQDWLESPTPSAPSPPRFVFASIKGGVGRSTALAVTAAHLTARGRKVLVVDLDLEAPGIGAMLLPLEELPRFGMLDGYVERGLAGIDREFLLDMVAPSRFGRGRGLIDVVPAVGSASNDHPANVLAKIARAYLEQPGPDGEMLGFLEQTRRLIDELAGFKHYDALLIDARAGLNESTAAAILGLGAQILLFGEDTPQTFAGYRYLLAHLARFPRDDADDWIDRLRMVHAKASADEARQQVFRDRAYDAFREFLYRDRPLDDETGDIQLPEYGLDDREAPHFAWPVLRDSNYFEFDPLAVPSQLTPALYERTYQALLEGVTATIDLEPMGVAMP